MAIFSTYAPPGVYVQTLTDTSVPTIIAGLRLPVFIGVGAETLKLNNFEIIRGSSATSDIRMIGEDVSDQFTGTNRTFNIIHFPIVDGNGTAFVTNDPNAVSVTVDGEPTSVINLNGELGQITLGTIPSLGSIVRVSYFFSRKDTKITDDDVSSQADGSNKTFKVNFPRIVSGNNGGISTTDPSRLSATVNGSSVVISSVDGELGLVTLSSAPDDGDIVLLTYYTNTWQDTFDFLPQDIQISKINSVGNTPGKQDYFLGSDFVIESGNKIQWGSSVSVGIGELESGEALDDTQIQGILVDNRAFFRQCSGTSNGSNKVFQLEFFPTEGTGLAKVTDDISKIQVYVGNTVASAKASGAVDVSKLVGGTRTITLKNAPSSGMKVYASFYYNNLTDDSFTVINKIASVGATAGSYEISSTNFGQLFDANFDISSSMVAAANFSIEGISFPGDVEDTQTIPKASVEETVTLTFTNSTTYAVTSSLGVSGSNGTGFLDQTYVDSQTGLRFTILSPDTFSYQTGDFLIIECSQTFKTGSSPTKSVPGINLVVSNSSGVGVDNTAIVNTYNKGGSEPAIGDSYYISLEYAKADYKPNVYLNFRDVISNFGDLNVENRLTLASNLAFLNGAPAVALVQVKKGTDGLQANDSDYLSAMDSLENPMDGDIRPNIMVCLTTSKPVIQYMKKHVEKVSSTRYALERTGVYGYAIGTTPESAQDFSKSLKTERLIGVYPDGAIVALTDALGREVETAVDGSFLAAALAGLACNPSFDVATPLTRKSMVGFRRLFRKLDAVSANQSATAGLTVLTENQAAIQIRQAVTTDMSNVLTREPSIVFIKDYVQQQTRFVLDPFIAEKFLSSKITDIEIALANMFKALIQGEIVTAYTGIKATPRATDPTVADVVAFYSPVFPLNWIQVNYTIRTSL